MRNEKQIKEYLREIKASKKLHFGKLNPKALKYYAEAEIMDREIEVLKWVLDSAYTIRYGERN